MDTQGNLTGLALVSLVSLVVIQRGDYEQIRATTRKPSIRI